MDKRFYSGVVKRLEDAKITATALWRKAKSMKGEPMGMSKDDYIGYYDNLIKELREFIADAYLLHEQMAFFEYGGIEKLSKQRMKMLTKTKVKPTVKPMRKIKVIKKGTRNPIPSSMLSEDRYGFTPLLNLGNLTSFSVTEDRRSYKGKKTKSGDFEVVIEQSGMRNKKILDADYILKLLKRNLDNPTLVVKHGRTAYRNPKKRSWFLQGLDRYGQYTDAIIDAPDRETAERKAMQMGYTLSGEYDNTRRKASRTKRPAGWKPLAPPVRKSKNPISEMRIQIPLVVEYVESSPKREFRIVKASDSPMKIIRKMVDAFYELSYDDDAIAQAIPRTIRQAEDILEGREVVSSSYLPEFIEWELFPFFNDQLTGALILDTVNGWWAITIDPYEERNSR